MVWYGWIGLAVLVVDQALLPWQIEPLARWFTPVMWTAYVCLADAWVLRRRGRSLLHDRPREAAFMALVSIPLWLVFEAYNLRLRNWAYFGVPEGPVLAVVAYGWSFATIWPGLFETAALLATLGVGAPGSGTATAPGAEPDREPSRPWRRPAPRSCRGGDVVAMLVGALCVAAPPVLPATVRPWTFGFVWLGFVFLLDPLNCRVGRPSFVGAWREGDRGSTARWLLAGLVCGLLWEFWNYWSLGKWKYVGVPVFPSLKLFEMPLAGYLGFPPFALEAFAMYHLVRPSRALGPPTGD
jgi:hypothetical protein